MLEQKSVNIDGVDYLLTQFPALDGIRYQKKLAKVVLPIIKEWMGGEEGENIFGNIIDRVWENIDQLDEKFIVELVIKGATKGSVAFNEASFNMEFAGKYAKLFKLVQEIVKFNFSDVFTLLGSAENVE
jgi:hypothetical protein